MSASETLPTTRVVDLRSSTVRELNQALHDLPPDAALSRWEVRSAAGEHALAVGINAPCTVEIKGHVGYYCAGMNKHAEITIHGNAGTGLAENMMSGRVVLRGNASQSAGATGRGGLLVIEGDAAARCGISMKGIDIVVRGSVGHLSAFMAQRGRLVVGGDAGSALGDSLYEAQIFVRGQVTDLGADCIEKEMRAEHLEALGALLEAAGVNLPARAFRRYGSARTLYHFNVDHADTY
ncbi:MAG: protein GlxC [Gammaproteobacteria bacterium]|nr:protein GlxC [Gammaproteobacteria bacterium]